MNDIYITGDTHGGNIQRFSLSQHPELRELDETDVMVQLGDTALCWPYNSHKQNQYDLDWLGEQKYTFLFIRGNHDNVDWWESCPSTEGNKSVSLLAGDLRQARAGGKVYENIFLVTSAAFLEICGETCLCIGGAESTDATYTAYPYEKDMINFLKKERFIYRVQGLSWWTNEGINISHLQSLLAYWKRGLGNKQVDFIFSHQSPAIFCSTLWAALRSDRRFPFYEQSFLDAIYYEFPQASWLHGHQHLDLSEPYGDNNNICCVFESIIKISE